MSQPSPQRRKGPSRLRRETERRARRNQLAEMGKLAAGLAHELKNPLSTLKLNLQLLEEDLAAMGADTPGGGVAASEKERSFARINTLKKEADRLRQTLDDFLRFAGRIELRAQPTSINRVVEELVDFIHPQAQAHGIRVLTSLAPENPSVALDENLFKQALLNLLLNAIQAMPQPGAENCGDGRTCELFVRTLVAQDQVILYVSDTGIGIPVENMPHIFDVYFTTKKGGTGLGLATTRRIIEEHHGHISVTSEPRRGTSFRVELPLAPSLSAAPVSEEQANPAAPVRA